MLRAPFHSSTSNRALLTAWPYPRTTVTRSYPRPYPSHPKLVEALCPMRTTLTSAQHDALTWAVVAGWCR